MQILWTIAGGITGWVLVEFVAAMTRTSMPLVINLGMLFVGGLLGYTLNS